MTDQTNQPDLCLIDIANIVHKGKSKILKDIFTWS